MSKPQKNWYRVIVSVWRESDGHILRDSQPMLIDGISVGNAKWRAIDILMRVHDSNSHCIIVSKPELLD